MGSVVQEWVSTLTLKQQTVILCALRGFDGCKKEDPSKKIIRILRNTVLKNADQKSTFMQLEYDVFDNFFSDVDSYNMHFFMHLVHAFEIIGYKHPELKIRCIFSELYVRACTGLHVRPELEKDLDIRLC